MAELEKALEAVQAVVFEVGEELVKHYGNVEHEIKGSRGNTADIVTQLDRDTEHLLADELAKYDSSIAFRGEEFGIRSEADRTWLVDPIDGTAHFIRGIPFCTTMVSLIEGEEVVLSVINDFVSRNMYWATKGGGAFMNGQPIRVSDRSLSRGLVSFETNKSMPGNLELYKKLGDLTGLVSTISCGFEFSLVASGRLEGRIAKDPYGEDWDFAPGSLLVAEAGGVVRNIGETSYNYKNHDYLMVGPNAYEELTSGPDALFPAD